MIKNKLLKIAYIFVLPVSVAGALIWIYIKVSRGSEDLLLRVTLIGFFFFVFAMSIFIKGHLHDVDRNIMKLARFDWYLSLSQSEGGPFTEEEAYSLFRVFWYLLISIAVLVTVVLGIQI